MGGTDHPSNLIELTIEEHAEAHRFLYEKYGKNEDKIAWLALSGQNSKPEIMRLASKIGREKTNKILEERYGPNWKSVQAKYASEFATKKFKELYESNSDFRQKFLAKQKIATASAMKPSSKEKRRESFARINHQQGSNNSNYGKIWISNYELKVSKTHPKLDPIPDGWVIGRKMNW